MYPEGHILEDETKHRTVRNFKFREASVNPTMVSKKGPITELSVGAEDVTPIPTASSPQESPEAAPGSESNSPSLASTTTHSDDEDIPNDVSLKEDENQGVKGRKRAPVKETRTRKKGQKFQCTGYGDCNLCFTRSEHLSRHIRFV